jgi:hypothetical protein
VCTRAAALVAVAGGTVILLGFAIVVWPSRRQAAASALGLNAEKYARHQGLNAAFTCRSYTKGPRADGLMTPGVFVTATERLKLLGPRLLLLGGFSAMRRAGVPPTARGSP